MLEGFIPKKQLKEMENIQGLKILIYGDSGSGKSVSALMFPKLVYIDTEAKAGVYLDDKEYGSNVEYFLATNDQKDFIKSLASVIKTNPQDINTIVIDSETNILENLSLIYLKVEKNRTRKNLKKENPNISEEDMELALDDVALNMRSYGHVGNANKDYKSLKTTISAMGINMITIAHNKEIKDKNNITVDTVPNIYKGGFYDYDIVIETKLVKDLGTLQMKHIAIIKKDTTRTFKLGEQIDYTDNPKFLYEAFQSELSTKSNVQDNYKIIDDMVQKIEEKENQGDLLIKKSEEFKALYNKAKKEEQEEVKKIMKEKNIKKINEISDVETLDMLIEMLR